MREAFWRLVGLGLVGLGIVTAAGFLGESWWMLDLAAHFRPQYAAVALLMSIVCAVGRRGWLVLAALALLAVNGSQVLPQLYGGSGEGMAPSNARLRLVTFNVNTANIRRDEVASYLAGVDFDVAVVLETDRAWIDALRSLERDYRMMAVPRPDNFGMAVLTRLPVRLSEVLDLGGNGLPSIALHLETTLGGIAVVGTHPVPPVGANATAARDAQLAGLAEWARTQPEPVVILGDLNVTPWSHAFSALLDRGGVIDSGAGAGLQATWPAWAGPLGIPIDHCLHGRRLVTVRREVGPSLGSDHRALLVELASAS